MMTTIMNQADAQQLMTNTIDYNSLICAIQTPACFAKSPALA